MAFNARAAQRGWNAVTPRSASQCQHVLTQVFGFEDKVRMSVTQRNYSMRHCAVYYIAKADRITVPAAISRSATSPLSKLGHHSIVQFSSGSHQAPTPHSYNGEMSEHDFHHVANHLLDFLFHVLDDAVEEHVEDGDVSLSQGVLTVNLGKKGVWVINKQSPNRQVWWSSPLSGPKRFEYHHNEEKWRGTRDEEHLFELLAEEMEQAIGVKLAFEDDSYFE